jgi:dihydroorotate dehydrogenase (NAD+) catalytic subunit
VAGLKLRNPTMLASGLGLTGGIMKEVYRSGAGAVVSKSAGVTPRNGYPGPTIVEVESGLLNAIGLANPSISEMGQEFEDLKKNGIPLIASVFGYTAREFSEAAVIAERYGADAIELNVSCPHVEGIMEIGRNPTLVRRITQAVRKKVGIPVFVKLSPNVSDIVQIGLAAEKAGADALTAINTVSGMAIDVDLQIPVLAAKFGGLSGPAIRPVAVRCLYQLAEAVKIPLIGAGGVSSPRDALELILAGATAVQVGTAILYKQLTVFEEICDGLTKYMQNRGIDSISELVGAAHKKKS